MAIADKEAWLNHHTKHNHLLDKKALYNEIAKRIFFHVDRMKNAQHIDLIVDRSKNRSEIVTFDNTIKKAFIKKFIKNAHLSIKHRDSKQDAGLQAIDLFCSGVSRKYENTDVRWYKEFSDYIAVEVEYKF